MKKLFSELKIWWQGAPDTRPIGFYEVKPEVYIAVFASGEMKYWVMLHEVEKHLGGEVTDIHRPIEAALSRSDAKYVVGGFYSEWNFEERGKPTSAATFDSYEAAIKVADEVIRNMTYYRNKQTVIENRKVYTDAKETPPTKS